MFLLMLAFICVVCITANAQPLSNSHHYIVACKLQPMRLHYAHTLSIERTSMSFLPLPASCAWLQTADDSTVSLEHYLMCLVDYAEWLRATGVPDDMIADPHNFVGAGDLQFHANVVSTWPKDAPATHRVPTLFTILMQIKLTETGPLMVRFRDILDWYCKRMHDWLVGNRRDPNNPNETKEELSLIHI